MLVLPSSLVLGGAAAVELPQRSSPQTSTSRRSMAKRSGRGKAVSNAMAARPRGYFQESLMGGSATSVYISTLRYRDGDGLTSTARRQGRLQQRALQILVIGVIG
jgi:hypothetical protein